VQWSIDRVVADDRDEGWHRECHEAYEYQLSDFIFVLERKKYLKKLDHVLLGDLKKTQKKNKKQVRFD
jgi:hypothetical protein